VEGERGECGVLNNAISAASVYPSSLEFRRISGNMMRREVGMNQIALCASIYAKCSIPDNSDLVMVLLSLFVLLSMLQSIIWFCSK
jgi:hypothetical protein